MFFHKSKRKIVLGLAVLLLTGCGNKNIDVQSGEVSQNPEIVSWFSGETVSVSYDVPKKRSYIVVDQLGYRPDSEKKCFCQAVTEETEFQVINQKNNEVVYEGILKPTEDEYTYKGDFTEVKEPGYYYIHTESLGESYPFAIAMDVYDAQFEDLTDAMTKIDWSKDFTDSCMIINTLLLAYELHPDIFTRKDEVNEIPEILEICNQGIEEMLTYQDHTSGAVFTKVVTDATESSDEDLNNAALFTATIAKFCYSYKIYDYEKATEFLQYATLSWEHMSKEIDRIALDRAFFASIEMYRLTSQKKYKAALDPYMPADKRIMSKGDYDFAFLGNITYLCTAANVDVSYCTLAMDGLIREAGTITEESKSELYLVRTQEAESAILKDAATIVFASRVNYNFEYVTVVENHIHYLNGMNLANRNYFEDETSYLNTSDYGKSTAILAYSLLK